VINLDYSTLTMGVDKRLNEIFGADSQSRNPQEAIIKIVKTPSLANLRNIIMSSEWEVISIDFC